MAKRKQSKNRKQVKRQTRHFQLRVEHPQDKHVREILDFAKSQRREVTLIREAVALFWALENGDISALYEKFPQYKGQGGSGGAGGSDTERIAAMLELFMAEQKQNSGYVMQSALPASKTAPAAPPPVAEVKQAASVSADTIADNFLSMFA